MSAVIIFVRLAIGSTRVGWRRQRTAPVSRSKSSPLRGACLKSTLIGSLAPLRASRSGWLPGSAACAGPLATCSGWGTVRVLRRGLAPVAVWPPPQPASASSASSARRTSGRLIGQEDAAMRRRSRTPEGPGRSPTARSGCRRRPPPPRGSSAPGGRRRTPAPARGSRRASVDGILRLSIGRASSLREELDREQSEGEAADMGEVGHAALAAGRIGEADRAEDRLLREPDEQEEVRGQLDEREE